MIVYTVHENPEKEDVGDRFVFVKQGFNWMCLVAPAIWFLWRGHWLALGAFFGAAMVLGGLMAAAGLSEEAATIVLAGLQLAVAFEANNWRRHALSGRGYDLVDVVAGRNLAEAEWRYFDAVGAPAAAETGDGVAPAPRFRTSFSRPVSEFLREPLERPGAP